MSGRGLLSQIEGLGGAGLHAKRQFVLFDASLRFRIMQPRDRLAIELVDRIDNRSAQLAVDARRIAQNNTGSPSLRHCTP